MSRPNIYKDGDFEIINNCAGQKTVRALSRQRRLEMSGAEDCVCPRQVR